MSVPPTGRYVCPTSAPAFTLLELLVALIISGLLAFSIFSSLHIAFKAQENSKADVAPIGSIDMAWDLIRADLQAAQPPNPAASPLPTQPPASNGVFVGPFQGLQNGSQAGVGDTIDFFTNAYAPQHQSGNGEIKHVLLTTEARQDGICLVRQVIPNLLSQQSPPPDEEVICRNVTMFTLTYYDGEQWQTSWDSTQYNNSLPAAVEVTIEFHPPGASDPRQVVHQRRVFALSCTAQETTATGSGAGSGSGSGNNSNSRGSGNTGGGNNSRTGGGNTGGARTGGG
jgi:prepilin-type N-terminal cleavage/methylation domain-containing protein